MRRHVSEIYPPKNGPEDRGEQLANPEPTSW